MTALIFESSIARVARRARAALCWPILMFLLSLGVAAHAVAQVPHPAEDSVLEAQQLYDRGKYVEAVEAARRALALAEGVPGDDKLVFIALGHLGAALSAAGRQKEAEPVLVRKLALAERLHGSEAADTANALNSLASLYQDQGRLADAEPLYRRAIAIREKTSGPEHVKTAIAINNLGMLLFDAGRYDEAEKLLVQARAIREKILGPDHVDVASALNNLGGLYQAQGKLSEAGPMFERALAIREAHLGPEDLAVGEMHNSLGSLYKEQGRYEKAGAAYERALAIRETVLGPGHPIVATTLNNLSILRDAEGRRSEAIELQKRSLAIREKVLGPWHPDVAVSLGNMASLMSYAGRYAESEALAKRALAIREKVYGPNHLDVALTLNNLAQTYQELGRYGEARPLFERALGVFEAALGKEHPTIAALLNNMSAQARAEEDYERAGQLSERALEIREKVYGPEHPDVAQSLNSLGLALQELKRSEEALPLFQRSLDIRKKVLGAGHPSTAIALNNLAALLLDLDRREEAEKLYTEALALIETTLGRDHPNAVTALSNIAELHFRGGEWAKAEEWWTRSTGLLEKRRALAMTDPGRMLAGKAPSEASSADKQFQLLVKAAWRRMEAAGRQDAATRERMFIGAQWAAGSEAAEAVSQMAARSAKGAPALAALARERQDLVASWGRLDQRRVAAASQPPERRQPEIEKANAAEMARIEQRVGVVDERLKAEFPDYAGLANPEAISIAEVQKELRPDEVMVFILVAGALKPWPEDIFVWAVTRDQRRWRRADALPRRAREEVKALRCGLDATLWYGEGAKDCARLLDLPEGTTLGGSERPPFDHARAYRLYKALFSGVDDLIGNRHILAATSVPLTQLPLNVLITSNPRGKDDQEIAWLVRKNPITVLPSVAALKSLRRVGKPSQATAPLIGFGNPLLDGDQSHKTWGGYFKKKAAEARAATTCARPGSTKTAALRGAPLGIAVPGEARRSANPAGIRMLTPLPETADELCAVARDLGLQGSAIRLGAEATEPTIKALSASGELARYRVVHFATHGALSGQLSGTSEPGLILTPPDKASEEDDGYLSASEIAGLRIDADWVILSACNTAGGEASGASSETLSGLARAFFYAGARSLLVSHWEVDSQATVKLVTAAVGATARDRKLGRAEALRRAMIKLIDQGNAREAHPSVWAPFVLVGEGAAARTP